MEESSTVMDGKQSISEGYGRGGDASAPLAQSSATSPEEGKMG